MDQLPALEAAVNRLALHLLDVVLGIRSEKIIEEQLGLLQFIVDRGISASAQLLTLGLALVALFVDLGVRVAFMSERF